MELLHAVALLAALVVLLALVLAAIASTFQPVHPDGLLRGFRRRSLAIELARDYCEVAAILGARIEPCDFNEVVAILGTRSGWNRSVMRILQIADFLFIAAYAALLVLGAILLAQRGSPYAPPWLGVAAGVAAGACGVLGALCDLFKNVSIGDMLKLGRSNPAPEWNTVIARTRKWALYKWFLVLCATIFSAVFFFTEPFGWIWLPGACLIAAAVYGLYVLVLALARPDKDKNRESGLEAAVRWLYLGIVLGAVGLLWLAFPSVVSATASVIMDSIRFVMRSDDGV